MGGGVVPQRCFGRGRATGWLAILALGVGCSASPTAAPRPGDGSTQAAGLELSPRPDEPVLPPRCGRGEGAPSTGALRVDVAAETFGDVLVRGVPTRVVVTVSDPSSEEVAPKGELVLVDELPSGRVIRQSLGAPGTAVTSHDVRRYGMLEADGCHRLAVELKEDGDTVTSGGLVVDVQAPNYVDGALHVQPGPPRSMAFALGLHNGHGSRQLIARPWLRELGIAATLGYPLSLEIPADARRPSWVDGMLEPFLQVSWEVVWIEPRSVVVASFNPLVGRVSVDVGGAVAMILGAFRDRAYRVRAVALVDRGGGDRKLVLVEVAAHNQPAPHGRILWTTPLPADVGTVLGGSALLDPDKPHHLALIGRQDDGVVLAHATCTAEAPPSTFHRQRMRRLDAIDGSPPALGLLAKVPVVGALLRARARATGQLPTWHAVVWEPGAHAVTQRTVTTDGLTDGRVLFDASGLVVMTRDANDEVVVSTPSTRRSLGHWPPAEPLRMATDGARVLVLRANTEMGPTLMDALAD